MKLFLISQNKNNDYDTYDSAVVIAKDEEAAKRVHPRGSEYKYSEARKLWYYVDYKGERIYQKYAGDWVLTADDVTATYLGEAGENIPQDFIHSSFNAG